jgi:hypothetical protein
MSSGGDIDRRIREWLASEAPGRAPDHLRSTIDEALDRTRQRERRSGITRALPWPRFVQAAAVVMIVAVVAATAWLARPAAPAGGPAPVRFTDVSQISPAGGATIDDVVAGGTGLIVAGATGSDATAMGAAWTSADGLTWAPLASDAVVPLMRAVRGGSPALVAIGVTCSGAAPGPGASCAMGAASTTSQGLHWQALEWRAADPAFGTPQTSGPNATGYGFLVTAASGGHGLDVLAGSAVKLQGTQLGTPAGAAVATSTDGHSWMWRVLAGGQPAAASISAIAAGGSGLVAVGFGDSVAQPTVWLSADGSTWQILPANSAMASGELDSIAAGPGGYVVVGRDGPDAAAWTSVDGTTWRRAPESPALAEAWMTRVVWTGSAYLAVGRTSAGDGAAWLSSDGSAWTGLDVTGAFKGTPIVAGAALGSHLVLVGQDSAGHLIVARSGT